MGAVQYMFALALRPMIDGIGRSLPEPSARAEGIRLQLIGHLSERGPQLIRALHQANDRSWLALEIALAGEPFWDKTQAILRRNADVGCREKVRAFLDGTPLNEIAEKGPEFRRLCLDELRQARAEGHLTPGELDVGKLFEKASDCLRPTDSQNPAAEESHVLQCMSGALRQMNYSHLAQVIDARGAEKYHLLALAARHYFRCALEAEHEPALTAQLSAPDNGENHAPLKALAEALPTLGPRLTEILAELRKSQESGSAPSADPGELERETSKLLDAKQLRQRSVRPSDCLAFSGSEEQSAKAQKLVSQFHALRDEQRNSAVLLESIGMLEVAVGQYDGALQDFQHAATLAAGPARARAHWNAYQMALVQSLWSEALDELKKAIQIDAGQYAPFPATFEAERILGVGAFGVSFLCRSGGEPSKVVVKALYTDGFDRPVEEVFHDLKTLKELNHPAILKVRGYGLVAEDPQRPYLVSDYFEGQTLAEHVHQHGPLAPAAAQPLLKLVAEGLQLAHTRGLWHPHLTPGNIFVHLDEQNWTAKIFDFGPGLKQSVLHATIANPAVRAHTMIGRSAAVMLDYAAPEQLGRLEGVTPGPDANFYNFGKIGYFVLLGNSEPDDDEKESLPEGWRKLLGQCLARNPEKRPSGAGALLERLTQLGEAPAPVSSETTTLLPVDSGESGVRLNVPRDAKGFHDRGRAYASRGAYDKAIADFSRALEFDPKMVSALCHRGEMYQLKSDAEHALADFNSALKIEPQNPAVHVARGRLLRARGRLDKAIIDFTTAHRLDPKLAEPLINRGNAFTDKGDFDKAISDYTEAIKLDPSQALAYMNRGLAHAKKGDFNAVVADCDAAIRLNPKLVSAYYIRGAANSSKGENDKAIADLTRVLQLDPNYALAYNDRGLAHANKGDFDKAIADYNRALRLDSKLTLAYMNRAIAYRLKGDYDRAISEFTKMLRLAPKNVHAYTNRGMAYLAKKDYDRAIADFTEALWIDPSFTEAYNRRVEAVRFKSESSKAEEERRHRDAAAREDQQRRQERATAHFTRAQMHFDNGNFEKAVGDYTEALKYDPKDAFIYYNRGLAHAANEDYEKALADYTEAVRLNPKLAVAYYHRGVGYRLRGNFARAIADFTEAIRLDPKYALAYRNRGLAQAALGEQTKAKADYDEAVKLDATLAKRS